MIGIILNVFILLWCLFFLFNVCKLYKFYTKIDKLADLNRRFFSFIAEWNEPSYSVLFKSDCRLAFIVDVPSVVDARN